MSAPLAFRNFDPLYVQASEQMQLEPVYYVHFGKIYGPLGTSDNDLTEEYCTSAIKSPTKTRRQIMSVPRSVSNSVSQIAGRATIGELEFSLLDVDNCITNLIASYAMKNRIVTVYAGYKSIKEENFTPIYTGQISNVNLSGDGLSYIMTVSDILKIAKADILTGQTKLYSNITASTTTIAVTDASNFAPKTDMGDGLGARNYLRIGDEIISYTSITAGDILTGTPFYFNGCTRGVTITVNGVVSGLAATAHETGDDVANFVKFSGNPVTLALQMLLSTGTGLNYSGTGTNYDVLPETQGCGCPYALVDISSFETQRDRFVSSFTITGYFSEETEALNILQDEIYKTLNAYPLVNRLGQYSLKLWTVPLPVSGSPVFDESNIIGVPTYAGNYETGIGFFNQIEVDYDYQPIQDYYQSLNLYIDEDSWDRYKERSVVKFESAMITSDGQGKKFSDRLGRQILLRFKDPPPVYQIRTTFLYHLCSAGDIVYLEHPIVPNDITGERGGSSQICECMSVSIDYQQGVVSFELLGIGVRSKVKFGAISPANWPVWTSATSDEKKYAFLSDLKVSYTKGTMSDGVDGFYITGD